VIRQAPDEIASDSSDDTWIAVAELPDGGGIVGVIVYQAQPVGSQDPTIRTHVTALGVRRDYRRRLKLAA
jgi:ribosomal protein S18 acetylase RimI-like enzyme